MHQTSLVGRFAALLVGAQLALASSAQAAPPASKHPNAAAPATKKAAQTPRNQKPLPAKKPVAAAPNRAHVPTSISRQQPYKPSGTTGKSLVSQGGPLSGLSGDSASQTSPLVPTSGTRPAKNRPTHGASQNTTTFLSSRPAMQAATNPLASVLKGKTIGEQPELGTVRDLDK